jgi:hypothetical protein
MTRYDLPIHIYFCDLTTICVQGRSSSACVRVLKLKLHCDCSHVARYSSVFNIVRHILDNGGVL